MAIPENRKIPSIQVKDLLDPNPRIFGEINALAVLKSPYIEPATAVADFVTSGTKGSPVLPVYTNFSITEASVIDANKFNKYVFYFSADAVPSVISSPASYLDITGTILTGLANLNKIEMILDYNVSGVLKVFMTITQMANANLDPDAGEPLETAGFTLLFDTNRNYSDANEPVYHFLESAETTVGFVNGVTATMSHSSAVIPEILIPPKPSSPLAVYAGLTNPVSPQATYATQALMTADFANQVLDSYYYFTGNNGAYKYNGTATDSINNYARELYMLGDQSAQMTGEHYYYTGSTSAWEKTATSTGLIANYTEEVAVSGWEEWGTKPSYLVIDITSDAYMVGSENLNQFTFTYDSVGDDVTLINVATLNGNLDTAVNKLNVYIALHHKYNENLNPPEIDGIINHSIYGDLIPTQLLRPEASSPASYEDLGGGNYALVQGLTNNSSSFRSARVIPVTHLYNRLAAQMEEFTIICRINFINSSTAQTVIPIMDGRNVSDQTGFAALYNSTEERLRLRRVTDTGSTREFLSPINTILRGVHYYDIAIAFKKVSETVHECRMYRRSTELAIPFEEMLNETDDNSGNTGYSIITTLPEVAIDGPTLRPTKADELKLVFKYLTSAEVEAQFNLQPSI